MTLKTMTIAAATLLITLSSCNNASSKQNGECSELETSAQSTLVQTDKGAVAGYIDDGIFTYKGIPYAKAERFMAPQPADSWEGVRSSRAYGPTAPQGKRTGWYSDEQAFAFDWNDGFPDEDCLRVNVWTPGINDGKKRPVMVWLHGGGFSAGSGQELPSYDGASLARKGDVVVVTLNHRLNALGFLDLSSFGEKYANSGNVGLLDLVTALNWVKTNIEAFGGDASNVTIFGQSGGGGKVSTLLATPSAAGLFHKAIIQSGSMLRTMDQKWSAKIGEEVVADFGSVEALVAAPYEQILAAGDRAIAKIRPEAEASGYAGFIFGWAPTVDGNVLPAQMFDNQAPEQSKDIPVMLGSTIHEFTISAYVPQFRNIDMAGAAEYLKTSFGDRVDEYVAIFEKTYPEYNPVDLIDTDVTFRPGTIAQANVKVAQQGAPVYMYMFTWESPVLDGIFRSTHCMEIPFVFNNADLHASMTGGGKEAIALADKMSQAWINFARTGNPNAEGLPQWPAYNPEEGATMIFDNQCEIRYNHDKELMEFVRQFPTRGF